MARKRQFPTDLVIGVQCTGNDLHEIRISSKGQLCLLNHKRSDSARWDKFSELGGKRQGCFQMLEIFRAALKTGRGCSKLPSKVQPFFQECLQLYQDRAKRRLAERFNPKPDTLALKTPRAIAWLMNRVLVRDIGLPDDGARVEIADDYGLVFTPLLGAPPIHTAVRVPADWIKSVYCRDLAYYRGGLTVWASSSFGGPVCQLQPVAIHDGVVALRFGYTSMQ